MTQHNDHIEEAKPAKKLKRKHKIGIGVAIIIVLAAIAGCLAWLYTGQLSPAKEKVFRAVPLPIALIETHHITSKDLYNRLDLAKKVLESTGQSTNNLETLLLDQLIKTEKMNRIAAKQNVTVTDEEVDKSYQAIIKRFPDASEEEFEKTLASSYGLDLNTFKNEVVRQSVLQENLRLWFAKQENLNSEQYNKARDLVRQLDEGTSFEEVARKYSEDNASKPFAGDSGFIKYSDMLPEFQQAVKDLSIGDTKIVASRAGIHVLKINAIEGDSSNQDGRNYNLLQIYIEPADFEAWLDTKTQEIKAVKLL
ncbi:peptidylprolyl isomerase [bacterium]|nr:MAG: peptidylprolyl isomerase [bacterium]